MNFNYKYAFFALLAMNIAWILYRQLKQRSGHQQMMKLSSIHQGLIVSPTGQTPAGGAGNIALNEQQVHDITCAIVGESFLSAIGNNSVSVSDMAASVSAVSTQFDGLKVSQAYGNTIDCIISNLKTQGDALISNTTTMCGPI